jgi:type II secretory pathway component PulJ
MKHAQSGLSLVELLLALAITAMVMVPLLGMLNTTAAGASHMKPRFELEREADFAVQRIAAQVRKGVPVSSYSLVGDKLVEKIGTATNTLAESVTAFSQDTPAPAAGQQLVQVSLTLERQGASASASTTVRAGGAR